MTIPQRRPDGKGYECSDCGAPWPRGARHVCQSEPNVEAGDYVDDDPHAGTAFREAIARYGPYFAPLADDLGLDGAINVLASTILSWLADQRHVYVYTEWSRAHQDVVVERLDHPGNRADGVRPRAATVRKNRHLYSSMIERGE